jgi:hypothetical protein
MATVTAPLEVSVVIPLTDARGDAIEHLRTWSEGQTLARERYQLVIGSDGKEPETDRALAGLLAPHDHLEIAPGAGLIELWNKAVARADGEWLLFTENHCEADRECLERAVQGVRADPGLQAASIEHGHITSATVGELGARWFDEVYAEWFRPNEWRRLNLAGFLIRRQALRSTGGLDERYGLFSAPLISARLAQGRARVGHLPRARIMHVHVGHIDEHHHHSADYVHGECEARLELSPEFAERYFGHRHLVWNRRAFTPSVARGAVTALLSELSRSLVDRRDDVRWLLHELVARVPAATAGLHPHLLLARSQFRLSEVAARLPFLPRRLRYSRYLRAQDRIVRLTQLRWIARRGGADPDPALAEGIHSAKSLGPGAVLHLHGLERYDGRLFRWAEPVITMRLTDSAAGGVLTIDTAGLRGSPLASIRAAYLGRARLRPSALSEKGAMLSVAVPGGPSSELTLLCRPPARDPVSPADDRRLGLPIFSIDWRPAVPSGPAAEAREPTATDRVR